MTGPYAVSPHQYWIPAPIEHELNPEEFDLRRAAALLAGLIREQEPEISDAELADLMARRAGYRGWSDWVQARRTAHLRR